MYSEAEKVRGEKGTHESFDAVMTRRSEPPNFSPRRRAKKRHAVTLTLLSKQGEIEGCDFMPCISYYILRSRGCL